MLPTQLRSLPTVGMDIPLLSYISAFRFASNATEMLNEGYQKVSKILRRDDEPILVITSHPVQGEDVQNSNAGPVVSSSN